MQAQALLGMGRAHIAGRNYQAAIDAFNRILGQHQDTLVIANAHFLLAKSYETIDEYLLAAKGYAKYLELKPGLMDAYVMELQGDAASTASDHNEAIMAYQAALQANPPANTASMNLKIGQEYAALEDYTTAIQFYLSAYDSASDNYARATANLLAGRAYQKLGLDDQAYTRFMDSVINYPKAYDSFTALSILVNNKIPVDEYRRGIVDYYTGSYKYALQAFERYLAGNPEHDGTVHYFKGRSHYFSDQPREAIAEYDILITNYPANTYWSNAWDKKVYVQWAVLDEYDEAANTLLNYVSQAPYTAEAPAFLYKAGRIYELNSDLEKAAQTWLVLMEEYPAYERSYRAMFLAGISYYRLARYEDALTIFQRCLVLATSGEERASASLWIGKTQQALGNDKEAQAAWQQAEAADPTDYYSIRAGDLLNNRETLNIELGTDLGYDLELELAEAESWLRSTINIPPETDLTGLGEMAADSRVLRSQAYWELGFYNEASTGLESLRLEVAGDAVKTYRLMNHLLSLGFYKPSILACRNILDLAGMDDLTSLTAPIYFTHIRFGAYFRQQVVSAALEEDLHPLILFSLIRQESLFEPFITSSAGARGLTQVMPTTAVEIVDRIGWPPGYTAADLYLPEVAIKLGADYLRFQQDYLEGDLLAALAAYNGGAGNALIWKNIAQGDLDLFVEVIRFEETQNYLRQIVEFINIYKLVYTHPQ
jgi:soluble lytic murein transglycosylase